MPFKLIDVKVLEGIKLARLVSEHLETFLVSRDDVASFAKDLLMNCVYLSIVAHLVSLLKYCSTTLHRHQFPVSDVFFKSLEPLKVFLKTFDEVISQCFLAVGPKFKLS